MNRELKRYVMPCLTRHASLNLRIVGYGKNGLLPPVDKPTRGDLPSADRSNKTPIPD